MMKTCPNCGKTLSDEALVCGYCGTRLAPTGTPTAAASVPEVPAPAPAPAGRGKSQKTLIIVLIAVIAFLLVGIATMVILFLTGVFSPAPGTGTAATATDIIRDDRSQEAATSEAIAAEAIAAEAGPVSKLRRVTSLKYTESGGIREQTMDYHIDFDLSGLPLNARGFDTMSRRFNGTFTYAFDDRKNPTQITYNELLDGVFYTYHLNCANTYTDGMLTNVTVTQDPDGSLHGALNPYGFLPYLPCYADTALEINGGGRHYEIRLRHGNQVLIRQYGGDTYTVEYDGHRMTKQTCVSADGTRDEVFFDQRGLITRRTVTDGNGTKNVWYGYVDITDEEGKSCLYCGIDPRSDHLDSAIILAPFDGMAIRPEMTRFYLDWNKKHVTKCVITYDGQKHCITWDEVGRFTSYTTETDSSVTQYYGFSAESSALTKDCTSVTFEYTDSPFEYQ